ncbi:MAG: hypothetical protein LBB91_05625, partial [Clostridiales bacterium]|nr:hypothetical protein [Clostridiales bacterium]
MKKSIHPKTRGFVLMLPVILSFLLVTNFSVSAGDVAQMESIIPDINEAISGRSAELAQIIAFADGLVPGYGSNGKFLAPIEAPDPGAILIYNADDLNDVRKNLAGSYILMNDIDLADSGEWEPIGNSSNPFTGTFDGQGHIIKNLTITGDTYQYTGLFGYTRNSAIKNLGIENIKINALFPSSFTTYAGAICGFGVDASTIFNSYTIGNIFSTYSVGGICGYNSGSVSFCYNRASVSSSNFSGGICSNNRGVISNCFNSGDISSFSTAATPYYSSSTAGGICGNSEGFFYSCYNSGHISSNYCAGGICGFIDGSVSNCYNTGRISSRVFAGGICAENFDSSFSSGISPDPCYISNCYNAGNIYSSSSNSYTCAGGICSNSLIISNITIFNCYNTGDIYSLSDNNASSAGGICGMVEGNSVSSSILIYNCYVTGDITSSSGSSFTDAGGICGNNDINSLNIFSCVSLSKRIYAENKKSTTDVYSYIICYGGTKSNNLAIDWIEGSDSLVDDSDGRISIGQAKSQATYENLGWDFDDVWIMLKPEYDYPLLQGLLPAELKTDDEYMVTFTAGDHGTMDPSSAAEEVVQGKSVTAVPKI